MNIGYPVQIVNISDDGSSLDYRKRELEKLLLSPEVKSRTVCVLSVAGAFRKGKSFMLNFFLRYLYATYKPHTAMADYETCENWLGDEKEKLFGFKWSGGVHSVTAGILMWSDIFLCDCPNGDKKAIILLDTQGAFDSQSTVRNCATIFGLSTMLSSVQVYNLMQDIQENDLQHLQLFTEYGRLAQQQTDAKPFQRLQFLIRDWSNPDDMDYGADGGAELLKIRLNVSKQQHSELQSVRNFIDSCFTKIACFLMPSPGQKVIRKTFDGCLKDVDTEFIDNLRDFVPLLLSPKNLTEKEISGLAVTAKDWLIYFEKYMDIFNSDQLPNATSILQATAEANHQTAVAQAEDVLQSGLTDIGNSDLYYPPEELERKHLQLQENGLDKYKNKAKMGNEGHVKKYTNVYLSKVQGYFETSKKLNAGKLLKTQAMYMKEIINAQEKFSGLMASITAASKPYVDNSYFENASTNAQKAVFEQFDALPRNCGEKVFHEYRNKLNSELTKSKEALWNINSNKLNIAKAIIIESYQNARKQFEMQLLDNTKTAKDTEDLHNIYFEISKTTLEEYDNGVPKNMGANELIKQYGKQLEAEMKQMYDTYKKFADKSLANFLTHIHQAMILYDNHMTINCKGYINPDLLQSIHTNGKLMALECFNSAPKDQVPLAKIKELSTHMINTLEVKYKAFKDSNENKLNMIKSELLKKENDAKNKYNRVMRDNSDKITSLKSLSEIHNLAKDAALKELNSFEITGCKELFDSCKKSMLQTIGSQNETLMVLLSTQQRQEQRQEQEWQQKRQQEQQEQQEQHWRQQQEEQRREQERQQKRQQEQQEQHWRQQQEELRRELRQEQERQQKRQQEQQEQHWRQKHQEQQEWEQKRERKQWEEQQEKQLKKQLKEHRRQQKEEEDRRQKLREEESKCQVS